MKNKFYIPVMIVLGYLFPEMVLSQTTYVDNGTSNTYTLQTGDSLYIKQGTFTGTINNWSTGGKITIANGAVFKPANVNGYKSRYTVYGTMIIASLQTADGFSLNNYGTVTVNGGTQLNGSAQTLINNAAAVINFNGSVDINAGSSSLINYSNVSVSSGLNINSDGINLINYSEMAVGSDLNLYSNSSVSNKKNLTVGGNFNSSKGQINNQGKFQSQKTITFGGSIVVTNTCRIIGTTGITINNNAATIYNSGLLLSANGSSFTNSGSIISLGNGVIKSGAFTNYNTIKGKGYVYITGKSTLGGGASVGADATTADTLKIYTVNRTKNTQIFDDQWGAVYANAIYSVFAAPDTTGFSAYACASEYTALLVLPVSWDSFSVMLSNNTPVISWSANFDEGTIFIVQRSENGADFSSIADVAGKQGTHTFSITDNTLLSGQGSVIYYRVCAIEPSGIQKYTVIKSVKFERSTNSAVISASPNPFSSQFNIFYTSQQRQTIIIKVFNLNGHVQYIKQVTVNTGNNVIIVGETTKWANGMYIVQLVAGNEVAASVKVIKH
ncbi:MAG: T9SS type A sorting domain-containing protein [Agriterribacter sp.]